MGATRRRAGTSTGVDTTETRMMATGVNADVTATRTRRDGPTGIAPIATDTDRIPVQGRHIDVLTTETVTNGDTSHAETGIAAPPGRGHHARVATMMRDEKIASRIRAPNAQARQDQSLDHRTAPGPMILADTKDDARLLMNEEVADQKLTAHHQKTRSATRQQSKLNVRSDWQPCSRMLRSLKTIAGLVLRILRHETQSNVRRMIARDPTRPTSSAGFEKKPKESILEEGCKVGVEVAARIREQLMMNSISMLLSHEDSLHVRCLHFSKIGRSAESLLQSSTRAEITLNTSDPLRNIEHHISYCKYDYA
jgi:hypothetical protein